ERDLLRHEADDAACGAGVPGELPIRDDDAAPIERKLRREHAERRRLPGAVRAEEPDDLAALDGERDAAERDARTPALREPVDEHGRHARSPYHIAKPALTAAESGAIGAACGSSSSPCRTPRRRSTA